MRIHEFWLFIFVITIFVQAKKKDESPADQIDIDDDFKKVTWGSTIKLYNKDAKVRLASSEIAYGSGSRQQSVSASKLTDDTNHFWRIKEGINENHEVATPIKCGSIMRLVHQNSRDKFLHSHAAHKSPLSGMQEVSAFEGVDTGDHWRLLCHDKNSVYWEREKGFYLQHVDTEKFLHVSTYHGYGQPLIGHFEISCVADGNEDALWQTREGIYFQETMV